ncbi:hypothetical protein BH10BDE1_BH10BDE1_13790 [soil metagenome]
MKRYSDQEIIEFLKAIDRNLKTEHKIVIIGGTAATIGYGFKNATQDIDTANSVKGLKKAIELAQKETGFDIPVGEAAVFDAPYEHESRLIQFEPHNFKNLKVLYPEAMDLIFMKMMRLETHDLLAIKHIQREIKATPDQFLYRFKKEMSHVTKNRRDLEFNFLAMMEELFGEETSRRINAKIR